LFKMRVYGDEIIKKMDNKNNID